MCHDISYAYRSDMDKDVSRYVNLAKKIKVKSEAGQINWLPASFVLTYEALLGDGGLVAIQKLPSGMDQNQSKNKYSLAFKNALGQTFYTSRDSEVRSEPDLPLVLESIFKSAESMQYRANGGAWLSSMESYVDAL